jgi:predicted AAA+ superfamily ATPase
MFYRSISAEIQSLAKQYPIITLLGPRQSGKTTLVRALFKDKPYVNLEDLDVRDLAKSDPRSFLARYSEGAVLDEIQRVPELLSYIQTFVDQVEGKGLFILTGSHQLELHQAISQSLAGRTALLTLLPMSLEELKNANIELSLDELLIRGGYPRIYKEDLDPTKAYRNYFQTYVERDLRQLINVKDLSQFQRFVQILAGRIGQIVNLDQIGSEIGLSSHTVKEWISILEASFIIFRLQPYFENFGKRTIKSPKLFFTDVGLASYLLGISSALQMNRDPLRGSLFENLIILELLKYRQNEGLDPNLYYYRDVQQNEVDLIFKNGHDLIPIEIKSSMTFHKDFLKGLLFFQNLVKERASKGYLIYAGELEQDILSIKILNYKNSIELFR